MKGPLLFEPSLEEGGEKVLLCGGPILMEHSPGKFWWMKPYALSAILLGRL